MWSPTTRKVTSCNTPKHTLAPAIGGALALEAARRSKSTPHMHVLVCLCSNVPRFQSDHPICIGSSFIAWPHFVSRNLFFFPHGAGRHP